MVGKYKVITLCGSTRFKDEYMEVQKRLTLEGNIVISVGLFGHSGDDEVWEGMDEGTITRTKEMLDDMHKRKIDMADEIFVINVDGYIGSSTRSEIIYATATGKDVRYLEPVDDSKVPMLQQVLEGFESIIPDADDLIALLEKHGVQYYDKRKSGGAIWIVGGHELDAIVNQARTLGIRFYYKPGGGKVTQGNDAWWAM